MKAVGGIGPERRTRFTEEERGRRKGGRGLDSYPALSDDLIKPAKREKTVLAFVFFCVRLVGERQILLSSSSFLFLFVRIRPKASFFHLMGHFSLAPPRTHGFPLSTKSS